MRLIFYIFFIVQFLNSLGVFAEKANQDSSRSNYVKWEKVKVEGNNPILLKKVIWKSYNDEQIYFQKDNQKDNHKDILFEKNKEVIDDNQTKSPLKSVRRNTQIESYIPLNNFLKEGTIDTKVQWKSAFSGGAAGGTGHQNLSIRFDYGLNKNNL